MRWIAAVVLWMLATLAPGQDRYFDGLRYVDHGSGPALLLVHGFTASIELAWVETGILPDLARDHRVVAFDLRGHGTGRVRRNRDGRHRPSEFPRNPPNS